MASISQSLGILRASGSAASNSYAILNALEIIKQLYGVEVDVDLFLKDIRFPVICQQAGVVGGLLPFEVNSDGKVSYEFKAFIKPAFKLVAPALKTPKEGSKYVALEFIGELPYQLEETDEENPETAVGLPNLLVSGSTFAAINTAWDFGGDATAVLLAPDLLPANGIYKATRISPIKAGGAFVEIADIATFRTSAQNLELLEVGADLDVFDGQVKLGQLVVSSGMLQELLNFSYTVGMTFLAESIEKIGKKSLKFNSGDLSFWAPASMKKFYISAAPNYPTELLCEVVGENEKEGKMYPKVGVVYANNKEYAVKLEKAVLLEKAA